MKSLERIAAKSAKHVKPGQSFGDLCAEDSWPIGWGEMLEEWARVTNIEFCDDCREQVLDTIEQALPKRARALVAQLRMQIFHVLIAHEECAYQLGKAVGRRESRR